MKTNKNIIGSIPHLIVLCYKIWNTLLILQRVRGRILLRLTHKVESRPLNNVVAFKMVIVVSQKLMRTPTDGSLRRMPSGDTILMLE